MHHLDSRFYPQPLLARTESSGCVRRGFAMGEEARTVLRAPFCGRRELQRTGSPRPQLYAFRICNTHSDPGVLLLLVYG